MGKELSRKPKQIRNRLRRGSDPGRDLAMLEETGFKPVSEWDMEELARGKPRDRNGSFSGGHSPSWLTEDVRAEALKRLKENSYGELMALIPLAVKAILDTLTSTEVDENGRPLVDAKTKLQASTWLMEHAVGKAMQRTSVEVSAVDPVQRAIASAIVLDDGGDQSHLILDAEIVEDDDSDLPDEID